MSLSLKQANVELQKLFMPYAADKAAALKVSGGRLAYYTSAETASRILSNKEIWMRNTQTMNDYQEIHHGAECLSAAIKSAVGKELLSALDKAFEGLGSKAYADLGSYYGFISSDTFITCVSEHLAGEDEHGRLSMWRAYGSASGIALVVNADFLTEEADIGVYSSPVLYEEAAGFQRQFERVASGILDRLDYVQSCQPEDVHRHFFNSLRFAVLCTKHPGFSEEREWRLICCPSVNPSGVVREEIEHVRGIPQRVLKIPLDVHEEIDLGIQRLLNRVIIGPCEFPHVVSDAILRHLQNAHVDYPPRLVFQSGIPIRRL